MTDLPVQSTETLEGQKDGVAEFGTRNHTPPWTEEVLGRIKEVEMLRVRIRDHHAGLQHSSDDGKDDGSKQDTERQLREDYQDQVEKLLPLIRRATVIKGSQSKDNDLQVGHLDVVRYDGHRLNTMDVQLRRLMVSDAPRRSDDADPMARLEETVKWFDRCLRALWHIIVREEDQNAARQVIREMGSSWSLVPHIMDDRDQPRSFADLVRRMLAQNSNLQSQLGHGRQVQEISKCLIIELQQVVDELEAEQEVADGVIQQLQISQTSMGQLTARLNTVKAMVKAAADADDCSELTGTVGIIDNVVEKLKGGLGLDGNEDTQR